MQRGGPDVLDNMAGTGRSKHWLRDILETVLIAFILAFLLRMFVVESFLVQGTSMHPTLHDNEYLLVDKLVYRLGSLRRSDVVVFRYPMNPSKDFIKRVVAVAGDRVRIEDGRLYVNGEYVPEPYVLNRDRGDMPERIVPPGHIFVLGDNRVNSEDSRSFGTVSMNLVVGRAFVVWWPPTDIRRVNPPSTTTDGYPAADEQGARHGFPQAVLGGLSP